MPVLFVRGSGVSSSVCMSPCTPALLLCLLSRSTGDVRVGVYSPCAVLAVCLSPLCSFTFSPAPASLLLSCCVQMGLGLARVQGLSREEGGVCRVRWMKGRVAGSCRRWGEVDREEAEVGVVVRRGWEGPGADGAWADVDETVVVRPL
jgi:hypothetical protein